MTTYRLMDGASGRPGVGSTVTTPPTSPIADTGNWQAGLIFWVTEVCWFEGFWWYVPAGGDTASQEFCLYQVVTNNGANDTAGTLLATATSGTLTAGAFNFIPLASPVPLSQGATGTGAGGLFVATTAWSMTNGFPFTTTQMGGGNPYATGITNGPLNTFGNSNTPANLTESFVAGSTFATAGSDPVATAPPLGTNASYGLLWLDVQVSDTTPPGYSGSFNLWPNRGGTNTRTVLDSAVNYVIATEFALSESCAINTISYYSPPGTAQLATRASIWSITGGGLTGSELVAVASPSWSGAAGTGWVSCAAGGTVLPAGKYKVSVYDDAASPDQWSAKDADSLYWDTGEASNGISNGPLSAPNLSAASLADKYLASGTEPGQNTFAIGPPNAYPNIYVDGVAQVYWVDVEVTPSTEVDADVTGVAAAVTAAGGTGTPTGSTPNANVTGVAAAVAVAGGTGTTHTSGGGMTLQTISPTQLAIGGGGPLDLTTALAASPYTSSNSGVLFQNSGRVVLVVQASAATTVTSDIGTTVQGQTVPGVMGNISAAGIYFYGPYPSQYDKQDGSADIEVDFGTPASVTSVLLLAIPGVV